jgi:nicotinate-nucleotide adenylyltransferase
MLLWIAREWLRMKRFDKKETIRIGLSMGTFNPIHLWHLQVGQCAWVQKNLKFVLFIPNGDPPHKEGVVSKWRRYKWVKWAVAGNEMFRACPIEVCREGKSYTVDTLRQLQALYTRWGYTVELCLIIGMDNVDKIPRWHQAPELLKLCKLLIAPRDSMNMTPEAIAATLPELEHETDWSMIACPDTDMSSTLVRQWYADPAMSHCADYVVSNMVRRDINRDNPYRNQNLQKTA